jgi:hypothetical protein
MDSGRKRALSAIHNFSAKRTYRSGMKLRAFMPDQEEQS